MNKSVLITGASRGIGKAFAEVFAKNGYSLLLIARTLSELESIKTDLSERYKIGVKVLSVDVSKSDSVDIIMNHFKDEIPTLDILINNAGFGISKPFLEMKKEDVEGMMAVNMQFLTNLTYAILPFMAKNKRGKILNVSSIAGYAPGPYMAMYFATKAYVSSLSFALYEECKPLGICVSTLCPGLTKSTFHLRSGHTTLAENNSLSMSAESVAEIAYDGLMKNKRVMITGYSNKLAVMIMKLIPDFLLAQLTAKINRI